MDFNFSEISFDHTDENGVTFVDGYFTDEEKEGKVIGYIFNGEFYPTNNDHCLDNFIMESVKEFIQESEQDKIEQSKENHEKLREILKSHGGEEFEDCIVDEICFLFGQATTTDVTVELEHVIAWFYDHDFEWQNDMENDFYDSDNTEGAISYIDWAYMRYNEGVTIID